MNLLSNELHDRIYVFLLPLGVLNLCVESTSEYDSLSSALTSVSEVNACPQAADLEKVLLTFTSTDMAESKSKQIAAYQKSLYIHKIGRAVTWKPIDAFFCLDQFQATEAVVLAFCDGVLFVAVSESVSSGAVLAEDDHGTHATIHRGSAFFPLNKHPSRKVGFTRLNELGKPTNVTLTFSVGG